MTTERRKSPLLAFHTAASTALIVAALVGTAIAQDGKGAPDELIGRYGNSPTECRSYHRKTDGITIIGKNTYTFCGGSGCDAIIVSHKKTPAGYVLNFKSGRSEEIRVIDDRVIVSVGGGVGGRDETLVRCGLPDAIAGIGASVAPPGALTSSLEVLFSANYALAVPNVCPALKTNEGLAVRLAEMGLQLWGKFLKEHGLLQRGVLRGSLEQRLESTAKMSKRDAEYAVKMDFAEIPNFCEHVLGAFGLDGSIYPDLIRDPRKKT